MRIKIIGDNNCARATRHLLRMAGFAVTEFLPAEAITHAPHVGYAITIDLSPALHPLHGEPRDPTLAPDRSTHGQPADAEREASSVGLLQARPDGASSSFFADGSAIGVALVNGTQAEACAAHIHFDSVDSALEAAILRHVTQLAADPVVVDRRGGMVHSERELRIVVPRTGNAKADEAAAVAVEFGVLRGLIDLTSPILPEVLADKAAVTAGNPPGAGAQKKWWTFSLAMFTGALLALAGNAQASPRYSGARKLEPARSGATAEFVHAGDVRGMNGAYLHLKAALAPAAAQGQFATGLVVDPCKGLAKLYVSINQTANTQLAAGTSGEKIYICSIHVVVAAATSVALVEGTGSVCGTGTAGVGGFGGTTAATGWNFAANGGIVLGNGDAAVGAEGTSGDNLCLYISGSEQVSGGISYVVQ